MTPSEFEIMYDVKHIFNYTLDETRCHVGRAPTLNSCVMLFGRESTRKVMRGALDTFIDFVKAKDKPNNAQRDTICWLVMSQFGSLKITEWLLFSMKAMSGQFGKFYNCLDPLDITTAVRSWAKECEAFRNEYRSEQVRKDREAERQFEVMSEAKRQEALKILERIEEKLKAKLKEKKS